jgi:membrane-bound ClpP family serine protease
MEKLPFGKKNYRLMIIGLAIIIAGFTIMSLDSEPQGFGFLGLTLGPIVTVFGFLFQIYAILHKPDEQKKLSQTPPKSPPKGDKAYSK